MQVNLVPNSPSPSAKENVQQAGTAQNKRACGSAGAVQDVVYSVEGVDYCVKHDDNGESHHRVQQQDAEAMAGGGNEKSKKKMGSLFRKSSKKSSGGNQDQGADNTNNTGNAGDQNGHQKDDNNGNNGGDDKKDWKRMSAKASFGPERLEFAAAATLPRHPGSEADAPVDTPSWTPVDGTEFKVRAGPNYAKTSLKEASRESLYEVYSVRYFRSERRTTGGATRILPLPAMGARLAPMGGDGAPDAARETAAAEEQDESTGAGVPSSDSHPELKDTAIPDVLVVHFMLPYDTPTVFGQKDDGPGGECVYYLRPSRRFLDEISGRTPASPAALLFAKWCADCRTDDKLRARFKCMALVRDIEKHNFGILKSYNGKPVLITESGRVCQGYHGNVRYLEMTANVHRWAFIAKKGFVSLIPKFANMQMEVGFTVEARSDNEMPECMLGSTVLSYVSKNTGPLITKEMQEPVHEHQA